MKQLWSAALRMWLDFVLLAFSLFWFGGCVTVETSMESYTLDYKTAPDPGLQDKLERLDATLRSQYGMTTEQTAVGLLDLQKLHLAILHPDRIEYAASVAKIGILFAYFKMHPEACRNLDPQTRHELGMMIKASSNEMAAKYSRAMGLREIQHTLNDAGFYDAQKGGGIWVGKHYAAGGERIGDPVGNHSHGATVRELLRFYLLLEQGKLVSPAASKIMREIFESPDIPHDNIKFVKGLAGREDRILRKWGSWEDWLHDSAVIKGRGRHYILVALTHHPKGDEYLAELARRVDEGLSRGW